MEHPVIAIVDDDPSVCAGLQRLLRAAGLQAMTFGSGPAFLASRDKTSPDCVVLDIRMPAMTGFQVQARMREMGCTVPVIFISAEERTRRHGDAVQAGGYALLLKPFDGKLLVRAIAAAIAERRAGHS